MLDKRWRPGDIILNETYTGGSNHLILVFPAIVAADTADYLALYHPLGHTFGFSAPDSDFDWPGGTRDATSMADQIRLFLAWQPRLFRQYTSRWHVLYIEPHGVSHAIQLFWDADWQLDFWKVNLQSPYTRSDRGVQIVDHYLDVMATPDFAWSWKDAEQFAAFCDAGAYTVESAAAIRAEGDALIRRIEAREWPFNAQWPVWRPDPGWPVPHIADLWSQAAYPFALAPRL